MALKKITLVALAVGAFALPAGATGIQWGGQYRVEGVWLDNPTLGASGEGHRYGLHHLTLRPEIVPADRFLIRGQVEVFNSAQHNEANTLGDFWGGGGGVAVLADQSAEEARTLRSSVDPGFLYVSQLYLQWFQDYGQLTVGRAPLDFGLGMSYSKGDGLWDHWMTTRDILSYQIHLGNFTIAPTYAKLTEARIQTEDDINEFLGELNYENVDTGLSGGVLYRMRRGGRFANDSPSPGPGYSGGLDSGGYEEDQTSFYFKRQRSTWSLGLELSFVEGQTGWTDPAGAPVTINSFGLAGELAWSRPESKWNWLLKAGMASGDDPGTTDVIEGFYFDRNYDVSLLLFNHILGARGTNVLRTAGRARAANPADDSESVLADAETISNSIYVSPQVRYKWSDRLTLEGRLTFATLQQAEAGWEKDLGYELDLFADYSINSRVTWRNGFGFLFPGKAFTGIDEQYPNGFAFGWISQAAIQF